METTKVFPPKIDRDKSYQLVCVSPARVKNANGEMEIVTPESHGIRTYDDYDLILILLESERFRLATDEDRKALKKN